MTLIICQRSSRGCTDGQITKRETCEPSPGRCNHFHARTAPNQRPPDGNDGSQKKKKKKTWRSALSGPARSLIAIKCFCLFPPQKSSNLCTPNLTFCTEIEHIPTPGAARSLIFCETEGCKIPSARRKIFIFFYCIVFLLCKPSPLMKPRDSDPTCHCRRLFSCSPVCLLRFLAVWLKLIFLVNFIKASFNCARFFDTCSGYGRAACGGASPLPLSQTYCSVVGLLSLITQTRTHAYTENCCRNGHSKGF